jgi:hypothetical protein
MNMNSKACIRCMEVWAAVIILIVLATATALVEQAYAQGEEPENVLENNIAVSCFKENLDAGNYIGSLTVTSPQAAGRRCNSLYYDCQGKCLGCFTDSDRGVQVCYDNDGRKIQN